MEISKDTCVELSSGEIGIVDAMIYPSIEVGQEVNVQICEGHMLTAITGQVELILE